MNSTEQTSDSGPVRSLRYATTDVDQAHDFLRSTYVDFTVRLSESAGRVDLRSQVSAIDDAVINRLHYSARGQLNSEPNDAVPIVHLHGGRFALVDRRRVYQVRLGGTILFPPHRRLGVDFSAVALTTLALPYHRFEEIAQMVTGLDGYELQFDEPRPISSALEQHWIRTVDYINQSLLTDTTLAANPLVIGPARRLLASTALAVFPNSTMRFEPGPREHATPAVVRRAMAYVEENATDDVTLAQMAAAARVGPRALQLAFRRHRACTPTAYIRQVRLERVHRDLQAGDPQAGDTVAAIAARWGFTNQARFSTDYRAAYGHPPSKTLRA